MAGIAVAVAAILFAEQPRTTVDITMSRYQFDPSAVEVPAERDLTLTFTNEDDVAHDVSFGREIVLDDNRRVAFAEDLFTDVALSVDPPEALVRAPDEHALIVVPPGSTVTLRFNLPSEKTGEWQMGCFHSGGCQYEAGLHGAFIVR